MKACFSAKIFMLSKLSEGWLTGSLEQILIAFVYFGVNLSIRNWDRDFQTLSFMSYSAVTLSLPVASALMIISTGTKLARLLHRVGDDGYEVKADGCRCPERAGHVHSD